MDLRRTGNVEAIAGGAEPAQLSAKLSNTLSQSNQIFDTYSPVQLAAVREADKARIEGRRRMKLSNIVAAIEAEQNPATENKSRNFPTGAPATESERDAQRALLRAIKKSKINMMVMARATGLEPATSDVTGQKNTRHISGL